MEPANPLASTTAPAWLESLLAHSSDGCLLIDSAGVVLRANQALEEIFGVPCAALQGRPAAAALQLLEQRAFPLDYAPPPPPDALVRYLRLKGRRPCLIRQLTQTVANADRSACGQLLLFREMTPAEELEEARTSIVDFVIDLRSPLMAITNGLMMVRRGFAGEINEQQRELLDIAATGARTIELQVKGFLELFSLEDAKHRFKYAPASLQTVVDRAVAQAREVADDLAAAAARDASGQAAITLHPALPPDLPPVTIDHDGIGRVIYELLHNAIKFAHQPGIVTIAARIAEDGSAGRTIVVWVEDQGPGIPEEFRSRMFENIVHSNRRPGWPYHKGTFRGLIIAHYIVTAHGGTIWAESVESGGSRFCFSLPLDARRTDGEQSRSR